MIEDIIFRKSDITFLANQIIKMPMIKYTPIKINKNDIFIVFELCLIISHLK